MKNENVDSEFNSGVLEEVAVKQEMIDGEDFGDVEELIYDVCRDFREWEWDGIMHCLVLLKKISI